MRNRDSGPGARSLERGISLAVIAAMVCSFGWAVSTLGPAKAQAVPTIQVTSSLVGTTTFSPANLTIGANDPFKFVLVSGEFAALSSDEPQLAFNPSVCFLTIDDPETPDVREDECDMQLAGVSPGTVVTYSDKGTPDTEVGTITVSGGSPSPTATTSSSPSASTSPTTTPSTSPTASPSVSPSDSPSATPTGSPSPTPSTSPSPSPTPTLHPRTLSLSLSGAVIAAGNLSSDDPGCYIGAPIDIQKKRKKGSKWKNVTRAFTDVDGDYKTDIPIKKGKYRARSPRYSSPDGLQVCARVFSVSRKYRP